MPIRPPSPPVGLCETCANAKVVETRKGSRFYLCTLSDVDPRFPRYPRLPVLLCAGYRRSEDAAAAAAMAVEEASG